MKEMVYGILPAKAIILDEGNYKGYNYVIVNYGTHPCAYIEIPKGHRFYEKSYEEIGGDIDCHGGLTFSANRDFGLGEKYYIGWDYAHLGDHIPYLFAEDKSHYDDGKRWTTEEILDEVREVIEQIVDGE